jgi:multiple sugar transport system permease protein
MTGPPAPADAEVRPVDLSPLPARRRRSSLPARSTPYVLISPALLLLGAFVVLPTALVVVLALFRIDLLTGAADFVGLANVQTVLGSDELRLGLLNTATYALLTVPTTVTAGLVIALAINALTHGRTFWRAVFFLPYAATLVAMAAVWRWIFLPRSGLVDTTIGQWLGATNWLSSFILALPAVALVESWHLLGFIVIVFLAGLVGVPPQLLEAARIDGARAWSRFWHVTWPALGPATVFAVVISTINSLRSFETIKVMTEGGPVDRTANLTFLLWERGVHFRDISGAAVLTAAMLVVALVVTIWQVRTFGRRLERAGSR